MEKNMIHVGIIGCGKIAQVRHLPEYAANQNCRICAVYDLNGVRAQQIAEQYGAVACDSVEALLAMPEIDAVSVCAANAAHAEITIAALKAGKHVLCEKPMAMTMADCERMVAATKQSGKYLMIGHNQRLTRAHSLAKKLILQGEIGRIVTFRTEFSHCGPETWSVDPGKNVWFFDKKKAVMGAMADLGIHKTDLIQFLTGQHVKSVMAYLGTLDKRDANGYLIGVDDNAVCIYEMDGGAVGTMTASWTNYASECNATVLYGTEGVLHIYEDPKYAVVLEKKGGERALYAVDQIQTNDCQTKSGIIDLWIDCLMQRKPPEISGEEALYAMRAVFAAVESAESGKKIQLED